ncbi:zinc finger protein 273-like [Ptychodera flava]|uniref:zinc finger protein 273-like n=1 Tax=Ptychodera flava TaxID=63121 RepID=UPI003969FE13
MSNEEGQVQEDPQVGDNQAVVVVTTASLESCLAEQGNMQHHGVDAGATEIIQTVPTMIETSETEPASTATVTVQYVTPCSENDVTTVTSANAAMTLNGLQQELALNQDVLICGHCNQQYIDIVEFLNHKAEHQTAAGLHRCELCRKTFTTGLVAIDHYQTKHKIAFPENINANNANAQQMLILPSKKDLQLAEHITGIQSDYGTTKLNNHDEICDFKFILVTEKIQGAKFEYGKTAFKCIHCSFKCQTKSVLVKHMTNKHCELLDHISMNRENNVLLAENEKILLLSEFSKMSRISAANDNRDGSMDKKRKKSKRKKEDSWGTYPCEECGKVFNRARSLRVHSETHRTEKNFLCDECGKAFKSQTRLRVHRRVHKDKIFKCSQCEFQSNINAAIHTHRQMHTQGSVLCDICGFAYTDKSTLNKHMRVHSTDRPFGCTFEGCTWRFKTEAMYKAHLRAHTSHGKFKCGFCGYVFRHKHHLQRHEANMHGVKNAKSSRKQKEEEKDAVSAVQTQEEIPTTEITATSATQQIIVADSNGNPITTYEQAQFTALHYQALMQPAETRILQAAQEQENQTVFQQ